jgi:hypothetical protein
MPTFELEESTFAGYLPEDDIKTAEVISVKLEEKPYTDDDGNKVKKVVFKFGIIDPDGTHDGTNVWGETPPRFNTHPDCKLRNWSSAILGSVLPVGYKLETDLLVGKECRIVLRLKEYPDKDNPDRIKQVNQVKDVMPTSDNMDRMANPDEEPF